MPKNKGFNRSFGQNSSVETFTFWHIFCKIFENSTWGALGSQMLLSNSSHHPLPKQVVSNTDKIGWNHF